MKILIPLISFGKSGGIKVISNLANSWINQGHTVTIVTTTQDSPYYRVSARIVWVNSKGSKKNSVLKKIYLIFDYIRKESLNYDVVIANYNLTAYPVFFGSKTKSLYYIQAYEPEFYNEITSNRIKKWLLKFIAWLTYFLPLRRVVNSQMYKSYKNISARHVVYPGIDLKVFSPKKRNCKGKNDIFKVGCIGRTERWKGSEDVADAIRLLHNKGYDNIELVVAFNAVSYANHSLVHPDGDANLADFYHSLDILITPGHIQLDAIHYPVIEAMATKTPLITTGYYPSNQNNAFIVPVKSAAVIADQIEFVISNYEIAISKSELAYDGIDDFSWENVSHKFISIINE